MLKDLFPRAFKRYAALPLLGPVLNEFVKFVQEFGYTRNVIILYLTAIPAIDKRLRRLKYNSIKKLTHSVLLTCAYFLKKSQKNKSAPAVMRLLERYFDNKGMLAPPDPPTQIEKKIICYGEYLKNMRGLSLITIQDHYSTNLRFLIFLRSRNKFPCLKKLLPRDIENFICITENKVSRGRLQHIVAHLRSFLRFLIMHDEIPAGLDNQIDTPRVYRGEKLPSSLDWNTVNALLKSIDCSTPVGKRDYSILILIATYGLRISEVTDLKLEDIEWKNNCLNVYQRKTATSLILPLTAAVGESIINYIRQGRPSTACRQIFVGHNAPHQKFSRTTIGKIFSRRLKLSGLAVPFNIGGAHCLRHSYAVHLLRQGNSLKTIGDILGHQSFESTCVYLRLNTEDLRKVPLALPTISLQETLS